MGKHISSYETASLRLEMLIYGFNLFVKNLKYEGVPLDKVKNANDLTWAKIGADMGEYFLANYNGKRLNSAILISGNLAAVINGMEGKKKNIEIQNEISDSIYPWQIAANFFDLPLDWRICQSGHAAFMSTMIQTILSDQFI